MQSCKMAEKSFQAFGVAKCRTRGKEVLLTLVVDWRASVVRGKKAACFCEVAGVSIIAPGGGPQLTFLTVADRVA